jgi:trk system potassium uptake protein TrkH
LLAVAILPLLGVGGSQVFKAEAPGPMKDEKLTPRMTETARGCGGVLRHFRGVLHVGLSGRGHGPLPMP